MKSKSTRRLHVGTGSFAFPGRNSWSGSLAVSGGVVHGANAEPIFVGRAFALQWLASHLARAGK